MDGLLLIAKEYRELVMKNILRKYEKPYEVLGLRKNGEVYPLRINGRQIKFNGKEVRTVEFRDITEQSELENEKINLLRVIDNNINGIFIINSALEIEYANEGICKKLGYSKDDMIKLKIPDIAPFFKLENHKKAEAILYSGEKGIVTFESIYKKKDGEVYPVEVHLQAFEEFNQKKIFAIIIDITERKIAELKIHQNENALNTIFNNAPAIMFLLNSKAEVIKINDTGTRLTGKAQEECIGLKGGDVFNCIYALKNPLGCGHEDTCNFCVIRNSSMDTLINGESYNRVETEVYRSIKNDTIKQNVLVSSSIIFINGERCALVTIDDISEQKTLEYNILKTTIEAEEKERERIAQELHDGIGPLLSTIKLYIQWLGKKDSKADKFEIIKKAEETINLTYTAVREISNNLSPHILENFGLSEAIKSFINGIQISSNIKFFFESNFEGRTKLIIEHILYRVITESINNTIKHSKAKNIKLSFNKEEDILHIIYSDDGIGFDSKKILKTKFGLGLLNIKKRLDSISARILYDIKPGKGVKYEVFIQL